MLNEMIDLGHGITGLALNLEETEVGVIILEITPNLKRAAKPVRPVFAGARGKGSPGPCRKYAGEPLDGKGQSKVTRLLSSKLALASFAASRSPSRCNGHHAD
jgi:F0F1-type ATP synthase alpha subunit